MKLSHFSAKPISTVTTVDPTKRGSGLYKPNGLWVSVDGSDDWKSWCEGENFADLDQYYHYRIDLIPKANILHLKTEQQVLAFTRKYITHNPLFPAELENMASAKMIDWHKVSELYHGIIIAPYQWECRLAMETHWYYGWDCASGCIWDAAAVKGIKLLRPPLKERKKA